MTAKEMMKKIVDEIPESVYKGSPEEIEIKIALYVYIELGKMKSIDEKVYWGNGKTVYRVIEQSRKDSKDIDVLARKRKLTCISIANLYKEVLNRLGIECKTVRFDPPDVHLDNIITLKSGRKIFAGLQSDINNIKTRRRLGYFTAIGKEDFLQEDVLAHYLMEVGYVFDNESFRENQIDDIKTRVEFMEPRDALAVVVGSDEVYKGIKGLDVSEAYFYYRNAIEQALGDKRFGKIYRFPCYTLDKNNEPDFSTFCIFADTGNYRTITPYLYSKKHGRMLVCDLETLGRLEDQGLHFGNSIFTRGKRKLENYIDRAMIAKENREGKEFER